MWNTPTITNTSNGSNLARVRMTAIRAPDLTPMTLIQVTTAIPSTITAIRVGPVAVPGHSAAMASAKPLARAAIDAMRVNHAIQPTSKPMKSPNASRVYR